MFRKLFILAFLCCTSFAACGRSATPPRPPVTLSWMEEPWTGNEKPFKQIRAQIEQSIAKGTNPDVLWKQYRAKAKQNYYNSQAQYRYGYAALQAALVKSKTREQKKERLQGVLEALNAPASPRTYEYARLRYLVFVRSFYATLNSANSSYQVFYNELGKRLVKRNPKDYYLVLQLTQQLLYNTSAQHDRRVTALRLAQSYYKAQPNSSDAIWLMGEVHSNLAYLLRNDAHAQKALYFYRKYVAKVPNASDASQIKNVYIPQLEKGAYKTYRGG